MIIRSLLFLTGIITVSSFSIVTVAPRTASIVPTASTGPASFRSSRTLLFVEESKESTSADAGADVSADEGAAETSAKEEEEGEAAPEADKGAAATSAPAAADDILNSPAFLSKKLDVIKADIAKIEEEIGEAKQKLEVEMAEWKPQLDALDNEYKNMQSRIQEQSSNSSLQAKLDVVKKVLEFLDNYDRAFGQIKAENDEQKAIEDDYRTTYKMILDVFAKLGVEEIPTVGTEFDYELHQAVMQVPSDEYEEGIICAELQKGYKLGDELVRAAFVGVAV